MSRQSIDVTDIYKLQGPKSSPSSSRNSTSPGGSQTSIRFHIPKKPSSPESINDNLPQTSSSTNISCIELNFLPNTNSPIIHRPVNVSQDCLNPPVTENLENSQFNPCDVTELMKNSTHVKNYSRGTDKTFFSFDSYDSKLRHPNFHKGDDRLKRTGSELKFATKAQNNSRYFLKNSTSYKHLDELDGPFYYYQVSTTNSSMTGTSNHSSASSEETQPNREIPGTLEFDISDSIMSPEDITSLDKEFFEDLNPFKRKRDYFDPRIYYRNFYLSNLIAVSVLFAVLILGSFGYLISVAKKYSDPPKPEIYEVLSLYKYPHLSAVRVDLVDPDTPEEFHQRHSYVTGESWDLVFSDEFNADGRTFFPGDDQFFEAVDMHYAATNDLEYYIPEMAETMNGSLRIKLDAFPTNGLLYRSAMLQSWNKMCFSKNALVEVSIKLPGFSQENGLWPAVWSLGNLARPGYQATTDGVWPYTYDECDYGITPNQSSPDGISFLPGQRLSKCTCYGEDHPNLGTGRGAPEIDLIEGFHNPHYKTFLGMQTLQVAPFDPWYRPDYDYMEIFDSNITSMKSSTGTPTQQAIAAGTILNETWFHSLRSESNHSRVIGEPTNFQAFGYEYNSEKTMENDSYVQFFNGNQKTLGLRGDALHPNNNNIGWRQVTKEPMALVFNLGLSESWLTIDYGSLEFPAIFEIDYIRIYQPKGEKYLTCDPPGFPTTEYINNHLAAYQNVNFTTWEQAGFQNPKNSIMNNCKLPWGVSQKMS